MKGWPMRQYLAITKALSDEARVRALMTLADGELCVCQIIKVVALSPSTVSRHMSILQAAGLIERRKDGRWHYYRLAGRDASPTVRQALRWALKSLQDDQRIANDRRTLIRVRVRTREDLTACYAAA
ncbi:MAG: transcriptional regulator [Planctomycetaceae bacterium]|nr:transcriptional regulator [Planctomycetaceae bacterium]